MLGSLPGLVPDGLSHAHRPTLTPGGTGIGQGGPTLQMGIWLQTEAPWSREGSREAAAPLVPPCFHEGNEAYINER